MSRESILNDTNEIVTAWWQHLGLGGATSGTREGGAAGCPPEILGKATVLRPNQKMARDFVTQYVHQVCIKNSHRRYCKRVSAPAERGAHKVVSATEVISFPDPDRPPVAPPMPKAQFLTTNEQYVDTLLLGPLAFASCVLMLIGLKKARNFQKPVSSLQKPLMGAQAL
eukprot:gnl/MRDRNA2_/MRDRNA2_125758_c0_seq1.p1 gnl/MRDRNA2_/MRDRNA2_125758_c0~~gnl/MRDRNA2_/MRDRNA2_125758_c0_seq1.p1  ORF type:complete len:169 (-),score=21.98 gnl/MRDRNA2_/MRDRNA2_125758_c0_seq1:12-518(-)